MKFHVLKPDFDNDEMVRFYASKENFDKLTVKNGKRQILRLG